MALMEALTIGVGGAVAKTALKLWLKDADYAQATGIAIVDILAKKLPDFTARRRTERDFERIAEEVAGNLAPFFEAEARDLAENEQEAAALAVADTFNDAKLGDDLFFKKDLDPLGLERHLRDTVADKTKLLSEAATGLYDKALRETCNYIIEITSTLPDFALKSTQELLKREGEVIGLVKKVLEELPKIRAGDDQEDADARFETQYRREVARKLDRLELFGLTLSEESRRYNLTVAYITLTAARPERGPTDGGTADGERTSTHVRVDEALAESQRTLIRGEAGSGKTTLLQWLAVQAARRSFDDALAEWNERVPFFIQLRRTLDGSLPEAEDFPQQVAKTIAGAMPPGWAHRKLDAGALVLIDGVDEVPESRRPKVRQWLQDLVANFERSRFIVTSRPAAVKEGWLSGQGFDDSELQPMGLGDIDALIDQWHLAAANQLSEDDQRAALDGYKASLKSAVRVEPSIRNLATSPLLCAMLCILNWDRKKQLPKDRMELYRIALDMLLERRDIERETPADDAPQLTRKDKELFLQEFAYWLLRNNRSDAERAEAEKCLERQLGFMQRIKADGPTVLQYLLERSGLIREPVPDRVDFIHRTFQEYLGAKAAIEDQDIGALIDKAHLDQWREVIILAAGHASRPDREKLLRGLLRRAAWRPRYRHKLYLLAVSCLETGAVSRDLMETLEARLDRLIPPRDMAEAKAIAAAGEAAISYLSGHRRKSSDVVAACVRALSLIGGDPALRVLKEYGSDSRKDVVAELLLAWDAFDQETFAREILADNQSLTELNWSRASFAGLQHLPQIRTITCTRNKHITTLTGLNALANLQTLTLGACTGLTSVAGLEGLAKLQTLELGFCSGLTSVAGLEGLAKLQTLNLSFCSGLTSVAGLEGLANLQMLALMGCSGLTSVAGLDGLANLQTLNLRGCSGLTSVAGLEGLAKLQTLDLMGCTGLSDLSPLNGLDTLRSVYVSDLRLRRSASEQLQEVIKFRAGIVVSATMGMADVLAKMS